MTAPRIFLGKVSASIDRAAGVAEASPMPTPTRYSASEVKLRAVPESAVISDQPARPMAISVRRFQVSASLPSGMPKTA